MPGVPPSTRLAFMLACISPRTLLYIWIFFSAGAGTMLPIRKVRGVPAAACRLLSAASCFARAAAQAPVYKDAGTKDAIADGVLVAVKGAHRKRMSSVMICLLRCSCFPRRSRPGYPGLCW